MMSDTAAHTSGAVAPRRILFALAFAGLVASFMQTLLVPIQGQLPELLGAPLSLTSWAMTITQLVSAVWMPISGRLADMFGKRRVLLVMVVLLILGSLLAAFASNVWVLLLARAIQGAGFGVIVTGMSLLRDLVPAERLAGSVGVLSATLGVGSALGMPLAGVVAQNFDWHMLFWVAAALSVLALVLVLTIVPESPVRTGGSVDWWGMVGLTVATTALLLAISNGTSWNNPGAVIAVLLFSLAVYVVWGFYELRVSTPMVDIRINSRRSVMLTNVTGITLGFALFTPQLAFPQILTLPTAFGGLGISLVMAGLVVMPQGLAMLAMSPVVGWLERRIPIKYIVAIGSLFMAVGYAVVLVAPVQLWVFPLAGMLVGSGTGLGYAAMPALIMKSVPASETGSANGINALARSLGTALAAAIVTGVLAAAAVTSEGQTYPPVEAFTGIFVLAIGAAVVCAIFACIIPVPREAEDQPTG